MGSKTTVALTTAPTIIWLFARFFFILKKHYRPILFHLKHSIPSINSSSSARGGKSSQFWGSIVAFAIHIILGIGSLSVTPQLAYLLLPPNNADHEGDADKDLPLSSGYHHYAILISMVLFVINGSVFWMIPHPKRYKEYGCERQREMVPSWTVLASSAMSFSCMAVMPLAFLIPTIQIPTTVISLVLYVWIVAVCVLDVMDLPWEESFWGILTMKLARYGPSGKSKLTQIYVESGTVKNGVLISFTIPSMLAALMNAFMLWNWLVTKKGVSMEQEVFFVWTSLYQTAVMCAGFFTQAQTTDQKQYGTNYFLLTDVFLTQILPLSVLVIGPQWTGYESFTQFNYHYFLWTS